MARTTIKERDALPIRVTFKDADGVAVTPSNCRYRVDCVTTQTTIIDWTSVSAASSVDITIPSSANDIVNTHNTVETKRVTVQGNHGLTDQMNNWIDYDVVASEFYT